MAGQAGAKRLWSQEIETGVTVGYSDYIIYVDESGNDNLEKINEDYPIFIFNFCIFQKSHYHDIVVPKILAFKFKHFGHDNVILHRNDIAHQTNSFNFLQNQQKRACFMNELSQLIDGIEVAIVATVIRMPVRVRGSDPPDSLALRFCMERACMFLRDKKQHDRTTHIIVEKRNEEKDKQNKDEALELAFQDIRGDKNYVDPMPNFEIEFASKQVNSAGLQLADLTAQPIGRHVINPTQSNRSWDIIARKIYRNSGGVMMDVGLKVFPENERPRET